MKLSAVHLGLAAGILWGAAMLLMGLANLIWPPYGILMLQVMDSVYPGYRAGEGIGSAVVGALYALVDGFVCGWLFGLLYNCLAAWRQRPSAPAA